MSLTSVAKNSKTSRAVKLPARRPATVILRCRLIQRGWTVTELARRAGYSRPHTSETIHGRKRRIGSQKRIARALGMGIDEAFPETAAQTDTDLHRRTRTDRD
jgi:transcriptional regulator with XRE-family HTH domain